jgi:radical SAM superfamily enzyme YgiQ (UPF0313 family)
MDMNGILKNSKKITLLRPFNTFNHEEPPLGIGYVAGYLETTEFRGMINVIDCEAEGLNTDEKIIDALKKKQTSILGISFFTYDRFAARNVAKVARKMGIVTIAGGVHVSTDVMGTMSQCPEFDYAVIAEGEVPFYELLRLIVENKKPESVQGIAWRDGDEIIINPRRALIRDLDSLPYPAYHLLPMHLYDSHAVIGSRGCPNVCKLALIFGKENCDFAHHKIYWMKFHISCRILEINQYVSKMILLHVNLLGQSGFAAKL